MSEIIHLQADSNRTDIPMHISVERVIEGISPTVEFNDVDNGTEMVVTDIHGEHSTVIPDGYTPVKGVDYWTEEDQADVQSAIDNATNAAQRATNAATGATNAAQDAYSATTKATNAASSANGAASSANTAATMANSAAQRAQASATAADNATANANTATSRANAATARANSAASELENLSASATTLEPDQQATVNYSNSKLTLGVPRGKDGEKGYSPTATVTKSGKTATITITDENGTTTAVVNDGQDGYTPVKGVDYFDGAKGDPGKDGEDYVLTEQDKAEIAQMTIDDTAAAGTTDKTWSADKIAAEIAAGTGVLVELNIARAGTVTTEASIADILADIEAGKHVYGLAHLEGNLGTTANAYAPMLAISLSGVMAAVACTFNIMEGEIQVLGVSTRSGDAWQMQSQIHMKAVAASMEDRPESFNAMNLPISGLGAPVNATDAATKQYVDEHAGSGTVTDVQVNGTSVVTNGVANVPIADVSQPGVVQPSNIYGIGVFSNGVIYLKTPSDANIKAGYGYSALQPPQQHLATFYGLAKASGDTTQSQSSNAIGTYTDSAKASIQSMLGVSSMLAPSETEGSGASRNYVVGETFTMNGKLYKATIAITENDVVTSGVNCAETNVADIISSLSNNSGVEVFDFNLDQQDTVTTTATVVNIIAAIDSGKTALGHLIMAGVGGNLDSYTPLAVTTMGSVMALVLGRFDMGDIEIWINGQSRNGTDTWGANFVQTLKATGDNSGGLPQVYNAASMRIKNLGAPIANADAATKQYVDDSVLSQTGLSVVNGQLCISYEEENA